MSKEISILITDEHAIVREGIRSLIETEPGMRIIGEAVNGEESVALAAELEPDVILMDLMMPVMTGLEAIPLIIQANPEAKILVLTSFAEDELVYEAIKGGALGYLIKDSTPDDLLQAISSVARGEPSLSPAIAIKVMREIRKDTSLPPTEEPLTLRELEVLRLITKGMSNQEIADGLVISERTVRTHVSNILGKLHLANRTQAALFALKEGLAELNE